MIQSKGVSLILILIILCVKFNTKINSVQFFYSVIFTVWFFPISDAEGMSIVLNPYIFMHAVEEPAG